MGGDGTEPEEIGFVFDFKYLGHGEREAQQRGKCSCRFLATSRYRKIE
jgi:hypothetical protein